MRPAYAAEAAIYAPRVAAAPFVLPLRAGRLAKRRVGLWREQRAAFLRLPWQALHIAFDPAHATSAFDMGLGTCSRLLLVHSLVEYGRTDLVEAWFAGETLWYGEVAKLPAPSWETPAERLRRTGGFWPESAADAGQFVAGLAAAPAAAMAGVAAAPFVLPVVAVRSAQRQVGLWQEHGWREGTGQFLGEAWRSAKEPFDLANAKSPFGMGMAAGNWRLLAYSLGGPTGGEPPESVAGEEFTALGQRGFRAQMTPSEVKRYDAYWRPATKDGEATSMRRSAAPYAVLSRINEAGEKVGWRTSGRHRQPWRDYDLIDSLGRGEHYHPWLYDPAGQYAQWTRVKLHVPLELELSAADLMSWKLWRLPRLDHGRVPVGYGSDWSLLPERDWSQYLSRLTEF